MNQKIFGRLPALFAAGCFGCLLLFGASIRASAASHQDAADFLYQLGEEHRRAGHLSEAAREYREALILNPAHEKARTALSLLGATPVTDRRQQAMDDVLGQVAHEQTGFHEQEAVAPVTVDVASASASSESSPALISGKAIRVPDAAINGTQWLYVFGKDGKPAYGALPDAQRVYIEVPAASEAVSVKVIDADVRGRYDEADGVRDTSTTFRLLSGSKELESQSVTPNTPDHATITFGPVDANRGEAVGEQRRFCLEAEGGPGNDNNLFALEVRPPTATCYSQQPAVRLADAEGDRMEFYPEIPEGTTQILEEHNYDLDPDGGRAAIVPVTREGKSLPPVPLATSDSGLWSTTRVPVPSGTDGSRWKYRITKGTQNRGNSAFRINNQQGQSLPIYFTRGHARGKAPAALQQPAVEASGSCNAFTFDGSQSYDPDRDTLTYSWDFGDGATAEGVRVEHTYAQAGNYTVKLKVKDTTSTTCCAAETEQVLPVNLPPKPAIEAPERVCSGTSVHLSAAKSSDSPGETLSYHWDFGDGSTGEGVEADHVFSAGGARQVTLTVDDGRGTYCSKAQATAAIHVNSPPVVKVNDAINMCAASATGPMEAAFSAAGSRDSDGDLLTYTWDFGDGAHGTGERVSHAYSQGGRYAAVVTVDDGTGSACSSAVGTVPVHLNHPPIAYADPASKSCPDTLISFNASGSSDADGQPLAYTWDFGDGHTAEGATVQHAYTTTGAHRSRLTVRDNSGMSCNASSVEIPVIVNAPPVAQMVIRGGRGVVVPSSAEGKRASQTTSP